MSGQHRDEQGRFGEKLRDQDVLKAFDFEATDDDPYMTVRELTEALDDHFGIEVTDEAVRVRLGHMVADEKVARREFGPSVAYRAMVAPRLSDDLSEEITAATEDGNEESTPLEDL